MSKKDKPEVRVTDEDVADLFAASKRIDACLAKEVTAKERYKNAKEDREAAQMNLKTLVDELQQPTLFNLPKHDAATQGKTIDTPKGEVPIFAWRGVPVNEAMNLTPKLQVALEKADLDTMGEVADWLQKGNSFAMLKGIGAVGMKLLGQQFDAYMARVEGKDQVQHELAKGPAWLHDNLKKMLGAAVAEKLHYQGLAIASKGDLIRWYKKQANRPSAMVQLVKLEGIGRGLAHRICQAAEDLQKELKEK